MPGWQPTDTACVLDVQAEASDVCLHDDAPVLQQDFDGVVDYCVQKPGVAVVQHRIYECTSFDGTTVQGMVVVQGLPHSVPGPDRCRLNAALLMTQPPP